MAPSCFLLVVLLLCASVPVSLSDDQPQEIAFRALACFTNNYIDGRCVESQRLKLQGSLNVSREETDAFCRGPCLKETYDVLDCVDGILDGFRFYNGAGVGEVKRALRRGCGNGRYRGDFNVDEIMSQDFFRDYNEGSRLVASPIVMRVFLLGWFLCRT